MKSTNCNLEEKSLQELINYFNKNKAKLSKEKKEYVYKLIKNKFNRNKRLTNKIVNSKVFKLACLYVLKNESLDKISSTDWIKIINAMVKINQYLLDHKRGLK